VILCTGFNRSDLPETEKAMAVDAVLKKPVGLRDFSETIGKLLGTAMGKGNHGIGNPAQATTPSPNPFFL
jgi:hypothetical protein